MFNLEFSKESKKFLTRCDKNLQLRILKKVEQLKETPIPQNSVSVIGEEKTFRIRIGNYRVLYKTKWKKRELLIIKIDKRSRIYNR
jgi:mRNA interferase RelE/StbE